MSKKKKVNEEDDDVKGALQVKISKRIALSEGLPHLYGPPWYDWAYDFFTTENREAFLCAANQVSKSSTQIRKIIHWATDVKNFKKRWPSLFGDQLPNQFWYLYPNYDTTLIEFETKWSQFLPKNEYRNHHIYGWEEVYVKSKLTGIKFNSGVTIYFKYYSQNVSDLQSGSVFYLAADEELPSPLLSELRARLNGTDGYFSAVFTATLGQDYWRRVMEPESKEEEFLPEAWKKSISLYDCKVYKDGSPSPWTEEKINRAIARCPTEADVKRRILGRFAVSSGLLIDTFAREKNIIPRFPIPLDWSIYEAVDMGSGGEHGHPAAILFLAVRPDHKFGAVFKAWRGDGISTEAGDVYLKHKELRGALKPVMQLYDHESKEFGLVSDRHGDAFIKADKSRDEGFGVLNILFRHEMLAVFDGDEELNKLVIEITSMLKATAKRFAKDDLVDTLRYAAIKVPWDFTSIESALTPQDQQLNVKAIPAIPKTDGQIRREWYLGLSAEEKDPIELEIEEWNSYSET